MDVPFHKIYCVNKDIYIMCQLWYLICHNFAANKQHRGQGRNVKNDGKHDGNCTSSEEDVDYGRINIDLCPWYLKLDSVSI